MGVRFHGTGGAGLADVCEVVEGCVGGSAARWGGIGGGPVAAGGTGNVANEDVVWMLERAGFETGIDLGRMIETARWLEGALGHGVSSALSRAGAFPRLAEPPNG